MTPKIVSINVGKPKKIVYQGKEVETGIYKEPVHRPLFLSKTQLEGDGQADLKVHGGPDKALCVYSANHYDYWEKELGQPLSFGAFGENITISGLKEEEVCIGDIYELGEALVQVSQPRRPCFKLSVRYSDVKLPVKLQDTGYTGFYFRVLKEGIVPENPVFRLVTKHAQGLTVEFVNTCKYQDQNNIPGIRIILANEALAESWRGSFEKKLAEAVDLADPTQSGGVKE
ncbi:MOSC domain-containing protein [Paenibacillus chitinolyticus]|uniref:MOSC domain-containing protein n=1 Tax=Paenibacillus chitinolyticus TaxID=79263 RepID=UPI0026E4F8B2|nr:MOSC domain-containing protein [Paenibacillus chitinolyticus]GKS13585.1 MOSC domain-containing protein [Paenibacillus chitinolyticus]